MNNYEDIAEWLFSFTKASGSREDDRIKAIREFLDRDDFPEEYWMICRATTIEGNKCKKHVSVVDTKRCFFHRGSERFK